MVIIVQHRDLNINLGNHLFLGIRAPVLFIVGSSFESAEHDRSFVGSLIEI